MNSNDLRRRRPTAGVLVLARTAARTALVYRVSTFTTVLMITVQLFLLRKLWGAAYGDQDRVHGLSLDQMLVYLTLANAQIFAMATMVETTIQNRIRNGTVVFDLLRPMGYTRQMVWLQVGATAGNVLLLLPAIPVLAFVGSISRPASLAAGLAYVLSLVLAYLISVLLAVLIGLSAFWTLEIGGFTMLYRLVAQFFAGGLVPLNFFPGLLQDLAMALPFRFIGYLPASVYIGTTTGRELVVNLVGEVLWVIGLSVLTAIVWRGASRRVTVQGG